MANRMLKISHNVNITHLNTLHLKSIAHNYLALDDCTQLPHLKQLVQKFPTYLILGGGSNLILPENYSGLIIHNKLAGIDIADNGNTFIITAMAGVVWDDFVALCITNNAFGLENLSLIPGTVGAAPVQNIGAYGVEVKDFIQYITIYDLQTGEVRQLTNEECQFSYRNSILKQNPHYLVLSVTFELPKTSPLNCDYGDIKAQIEQINTPTALDLRNCIIHTRKNKLPDPNEIGNVGSFFHNPIIDSEKAQELKTKYPQLPIYPTNNPQLIKISAGWLIDNLGLKGYRVGNVGVYNKQALVLVNHGNAHQKEILEFAKLIQQKVWLSYAINLNIEPIIIPA